ncbi:MAG: carbohydrate ABC transporter permease [Clostridia bacterium]|nr:carbohydrate ABC transporter permease [Clostridia bacterium]
MKKKIKRALLLFTFAILISGALFPIIYIVSNSFMSSQELEERYTEQSTFLNADEPHYGKLHYVRMSLVPEEFSTDSYNTIALGNPTFWRSFWNSVIIIVPILFFQLLLAPLTAYGFEMSSFRFKEVIFYFYIVVMMLPTLVTLVPNYLLTQWLGLSDSYLAVILPSILNPIGVFMIRQQLKSFPRSIIEAAELDGAGTFRIYRQVVLPNIKSSIAVSMLIIFCDNWNMIEQIQIFITGNYAKTLPVFLSLRSANISPFFLAASVVFVIPAVFVFAYAMHRINESGIYGKEVNK